MEKIKNGEEFFDQSTPLNTYISFLSACKHLNVEMAKKTQDRNWTRENLEESRYWLEETEIWRVPDLSENPKQAEIWPLYVIDKNTKKWEDTLMFIFWKGKWFKCGNMGGPYYDWRSSESWFREIFLMEIASK